jgi:spermidine/putrescine-binding protein
MTMTRMPAPNRRDLLKLGFGGGLAALGGAPALAQRRTIDVLMAPSPARPELLRLFQERTGVTVRPAPYVSPTDTMNKLLSGNAPFSLMNTLSDLVRPSLSEAVDRGLLLPFDTAKLPNAAHLAPLFREDVLVRNGQSYSMPIYWGYNAVLYNRRFIPDSEPLADSWGLLFDDKFAGRVAIRDDAHESIHMVALYMGHRQPLEMDRSDLREVVAFLKTKKRNFRALWSRFAEAVQLMASNEVHAMFGWLLMRTTLQSQGMDVVGNHPKEGLLWWIHSAFIPRSSPNPDDAHRWLDFMLSGEYGRRLTELAGVLSTSQAAVQGMSTEEQAKQGYDMLTRGGPMVRLGSPKHMDLWLEAWAEFKAA